MTEPESGPPGQPGAGADRRTWLQRRRDKVRAEIERNRRGEYTVPTWVLAAILCAIIATWATIILAFS